MAQKILKYLRLIFCKRRGGVGGGGYRANGKPFEGSCTMGVSYYWFVPVVMPYLKHKQNGSLHMPGAYTTTSLSRFPK